MRTSLSASEASCVVTILKVESGEERTGRSTGLFWRIHCQVELGLDIVFL